MALYILVVIFLMLAAGVFGGLINYFLLNLSELDKIKMLRSVVIGVGAAFLVPVVLSLIGNDMVLEAQTDGSQLLIFIGLCLIASIASRFVMTNDIDKILRTTEVTKEESQSVFIELNELRELVMPLVNSETETLELTEQELSTLDTLDITSVELLKVLRASRYSFRSIETLSKDLQLEAPPVGRTLAALRNKALVGKVNSQWGERWFLTEKGRLSAEKLV